MLPGKGLCKKERTAKISKTYNTKDSLVVTDPTTNLAVTGLSMGERTGSRVFQVLWSYVIWRRTFEGYIDSLPSAVGDVAMTGSTPLLKLSSIMREMNTMDEGIRE
jgi:hypothetical protein